VRGDSPGHFCILQKDGVSMKKGDLSEVLEALEATKLFKTNLTRRVELEAKPGIYREFPPNLTGSLKKALLERGVARLYAHQEESYRRIQAGEDIVVVTPTASGKTLCYNLAVLDRLLREPARRALYLFPTKALSQDQSAELQSLVSGTGENLKVHTYDGDTPTGIRGTIRKQAQVVISNPDMLHTGILPHHTKWNTFFQNIAFLVVDEMHMYRGVFGSHMVNVLRRLARVCRHYGSYPQAVFCSATIANPRELAERLIERPVTLLDQNGAPRGKKRLYFLNPPVIQKELGLRGSPLGMVQKIASEFLRRGRSTIVFTTSRLHVEILTKYLKDTFEKGGGEMEEKIRGYRGGYLPNLRREIEKGLRSGEIKGVVSTNALELGVDIGSLEACILCGYPGSIASTWQQAGRAGRRTGMACTVLVARSNPLDQFIIQNPDYFLGRSPEHARLNPDNLSILVSHIKCAAFELPFRKGERFSGENLEEILEYLVEKRVLRKYGDRWYWAEESYPADKISLRTVSEENFLVVDRSSANRVVAEVDHQSAPLTIYPGAIYMLEGQQYQVEELDYSNHKAYVTQVKADYYTEAVLFTKLKILDVFSSDPEDVCRGKARMHEGEVHVVSHVAGFKKLKFYSSENLGYGEISLPDQEMHTTSFWITLDPEDLVEIGLTTQDLLYSLAGCGYAMQHMACFILMCEPRDLGKAVGDPYLKWFFRPDSPLRDPPPAAGGPGPGGWFGDGEGSPDMEFRPTLFLYDAYPGGLGLSSHLFSCRKELLEGTWSLIERCSCGHGCPSCVGPAPEVGELTKSNARRLLEWMICGAGCRG